MLICLQCYMTFNNVILKLERIAFGTNIYSCKLRSGLVNQFLGSRKQLSKASGIIPQPEYIFFWHKYLPLQTQQVHPITESSKNKSWVSPCHCECSLEMLMVHGTV